MPKKSKSKGQQRRRTKAAVASYSCPVWPDAVLPGNYVASSAPGCHVAHGDADWIVGHEPFDKSEFGGVIPPDLSLDPETGLLTVVNPEKTPRVVYATLKHECREEQGQLLQPGWARDESGTISDVTTFVLIIQPRHLMDVCFVKLPRRLEDVELQSDVTQLTLDTPPETETEPRGPYGFPLLGDGPFLCSQGCCGRFTHFFPATRHAVDLECPVGTLVVSVADGKVTHVRDQNTVGGIATDNLYKWNFIVVQHTDGSVAEYVHVAANSARVAVGDQVHEGTVLCESGDVGFCPVPHLHFEVHAAYGDHSPTVPFSMRCASDRERHFTPIAGVRYNRLGPQEGGALPPDE